MSEFAKLFNIGQHQVVAYKDFEEDEEGNPTYRIVTLVGAGGGAQQVAYGYKDEAKRDQRFDTMDEEGARLSLNTVLEIFGEE